MWAAEQFPDDALPQGGTGNSSATGGCGAQKLRVLAARHKLASAEAALQDAQNRSTTNTPTASNAAIVSTQPSIWQFVAFQTASWQEPERAAVWPRPKCRRCVRIPHDQQWQ